MMVSPTTHRSDSVASVASSLITQRSSLRSIVGQLVVGHRPDRVLGKPVRESGAAERNKKTAGQSRREALSEQTSSSAPSRWGSGVGEESHADDPRGGHPVRPRTAGATHGVQRVPRVRVAERQEEGRQSGRGDARSRALGRQPGWRTTHKGLQRSVNDGTRERTMIDTPRTLDAIVDSDPGQHQTRATVGQHRTGMTRSWTPTTLTR